MTSTVAIGYNNWPFEINCSVTGTGWETSAPLSNLLTPRLGQKAIATAIGTRSFTVDWSDGSPQVGARVDIIALLNHNIIELGPVTLDVYDAEGGTYIPSSFPISLFGYGVDGTFQSHLVWVMGNTGNDLNRNRVSKFVFGITAATTTGRKNPNTGVLVSEPLSIGAVWAGPKFSPENGISIDGFAQSIADNTQVVRSIGGQVWADPETRQRSMKATFPGLFEREVYGVAPTQCLIQLAAHCGISRPLIVVPVSSQDELVYTQAIYGYLSAPAAWNLIEKVDDNNVKTRLYSGGLEIVEAR